MHRKLLLIAGAAIAGAMLAAAAPASAGDNVSIDSSIYELLPKEGTFVGGGIFNEDGAGQSDQAKVPRRGSALFVWRADNAGIGSGPATFTATAPACLDVHVYDLAGEDQFIDATQDILDTGYGPTLDSANDEVLFQVFVTSTCAKGSVKTVKLDAVPAVGVDFERVGAKIKTK